MTQTELETFVAGLAANTKAYVADYVAKAIGQVHDRLGTVEHITKGIETLSARLSAIEAQSAIAPRDGRDGKDGERGETGARGEKGDPGPAGRDADPDVLKALRLDVDQLHAAVATLKSATPIAVDVQGIATKAAALLRVPRDGKDAPPVDLDAVAVKAAALIAPPVNGRDGRDGKDGANGRDGSVAELVPLIQSEVTKAVSAIQVLKGDPGERGPEGPPGRDGRDGSMGPQGERGQDGRDGKDGDIGPMGPTGPKGDHGQPGDPGRDGINGKDGADGLGFDDMDLVVDEQRKGLFLRFTRGDVVKEWALPTLLDIGGYSPTETYRKGNCVSEDGSLWVARQESVKGIKPGDGSPESLKAWRLAVRRGKEGKQGKQGPKGNDLRWEDRDA